MKTMDLDTSKELAAVHEEEAVMEKKKKKKIRTDCKTIELQICSKESADAAPEEDETAAGGLMEGKKFCTDCRTTKTPLWRVGPSGPKSLCNACGIRYRKKTPLPAPASNSGGWQSHDEEAEKEMSKCLSKSTVKMNLVILGKDWFVETTSSVGKKKKQQRRLRERRNLREEEIAAASLVALSSGSVFV